MTEKQREKALELLERKQKDHSKAIADSQGKIFALQEKIEGHLDALGIFFAEAIALINEPITPELVKPAKNGKAKKEKAPDANHPAPATSDQGEPAATEA
jgi:hypothetical protein